MSDPLLQLSELRRRVVEVDGNKVAVRELSALEFAKFSDLREEDKTQAMAFIIGACVLNEDGSRRLTDEDAMKIAQGSIRVAARLVNEIHRMSGLGEKH